MGFDNSSVAKEFINFIKTMIDESNKKNTFVIPAIVESKNSNNTYNVYIPPDMSTVIKNIHNGSKFDIKYGDTVYIMALNGDIANSFIIYKQGGQQETVVEEEAKQESNLSFKNFSDYQYIFNLIFPVGSVYIQTGSMEPAEAFGFTWEKIQGKFLLGSDQNYELGSTGGSADAVVVAHDHYVTYKGNDGQHISLTGQIEDDYPYNYWCLEQSPEGDNAGTLITTNKGVSGTGMNMPPYQVVNIWKRIR